MRVVSEKGLKMRKNRREKRGQKGSKNAGANSVKIEWPKNGVLRKKPSRKNLAIGMKNAVKNDEVKISASKNHSLTEKSAKKLSEKSSLSKNRQK